MSESLAHVNIKSLANANLVAYVGPYDSDVTKAYLDVLKSNKDTKPMVSYGASSY